MGGDDPSATQNPWVVADSQGAFKVDSNVNCVSVLPSDDKFVLLRTRQDSEMAQYGIVDTASLRQLWRTLDYNCNGIVSLAEIDKMVVAMVTGNQWPEYLNCKPALMRAYKKTILKDGDGDDWVEKKEFHALLLNIFWFCQLWQVFDVIDTGDDRRIDLNEFTRGLGHLGLHLSEREAIEEFKKMDTNNGGQVLFVEFCAYIRKRVNPDASPNFDPDIISGENSGNVVRKDKGHKGTHTHFITKKSLRVFDKLEEQFKTMMTNLPQLREMWASLDFNGNGFVSLAEIDKFAVEQFPLLNHKPALMRAYKATIKKGNGDEWVNKNEFKSLLGHLLYFNKIYWLFDQVDDDDDRRLTFKEFKWCMNICDAKMQEAELQQEFNRVDKNGGGIILFDEFCKYFTAKSCPECLTDLI